MKQFFRQYGFILFGLITLIDLIGVQLQSELIVLVAKPLLLPVLFLTAVCSQIIFPNKWLILAGLLFSFAGDVFLLFDSKDSLYFISGLICFLLTHLLYIIFFLRLKGVGSSVLKRKPYLLLSILAYVAALLFLLIPHLGALTLPVIVYALVLGGMLMCSIHAYNKTVKPAGMLFVVGALLFVVSDSLLAINKFYQAFPFAGIFIMATYCAAQYFIVRGLTSRELGEA